MLCLSSNGNNLKLKTKYALVKIIRHESTKANILEYDEELYQVWMTLVNCNYVGLTPLINLFAHRLNVAKSDMYVTPI